MSPIRRFFGRGRGIEVTAPGGSELTVGIGGADELVCVVDGEQPASAASPVASWRLRGRVPRIRWAALLAVLIAAASCGASVSSPSDPVTGSSATTSAPATSQSASASNSTPGEGSMLVDTDRMRFGIDGVDGDLPLGWEDPHVRKVYVFLGYNTPKRPPEVNWLSIAAPEFIGIGPPGTPPGLEPAPIDVAATLRERQVPLTELGTLAVDGVKAPVFQLDGYLQLCSTNTCRSNGPARFYVLLPGANGDLIIEGESDLLSAPGDVTAAEATPLIRALQTWAASIDLP